ncbi:MAG: TonB-dependent receptor plug domain-containing protein, partial [Sphingorhabdus sp.]
MKKAIMRPANPCKFLLRSSAISLAVAAASHPPVLYAQDAETAAAEPQSDTPPVDGALVPRNEDGKQIYDAALFARFAPQTASDMARQIPGFTITEASGDRGLGEATQNVLINGQRISGKSNDADTVLGRTPASSVVRIEIVDGASLNIPGLSGQVLNLITKNTGLQGNFAWQPQFRQRVETHWFDGEINISGKLGKGDFTLGLNNRQGFRGGGWGPEIVTDGDGDLLFTRDKAAQFIGDRPKLAGTYSRTSKAGSIFNLN